MKKSVSWKDLVFARLSIPQDSELQEGINKILFNELTGFKYTKTLSKLKEIVTLLRQKCAIFVGTEGCAFEEDVDLLFQRQFFFSNSNDLEAFRRAVKSLGLSPSEEGIADENGADSIIEDFHVLDDATGSSAINKIRCVALSDTSGLPSLSLMDLFPDIIARNFYWRGLDCTKVKDFTEDECRKWFPVLEYDEPIVQSVFLGGSDIYEEFWVDVFGDGIPRKIGANQEELRPDAKFGRIIKIKTGHVGGEKFSPEYMHSVAQLLRPRGESPEKSKETASVVDSIFELNRLMEPITPEPGLYTDHVIGYMNRWRHEIDSAVGFEMEFLDMKRPICEQIEIDWQEYDKVRDLLDCVFQAEWARIERQELREEYEDERAVKAYRRSSQPTWWDNIIFNI